MDALLEHPKLQALAESWGRFAVRAAVRQVLVAERERLVDPRAAPADSEDLVAATEQRLSESAGPRLRRVLNATGVFLHTQLGRAPLPAAAVAEIVRIAEGYCDLEIDVVTGKRGERNVRAAGLLRMLTGAEDGLVANNNAAALLLALASVAGGRAVLVARGELVEIGGGFRIPDVVRAAGVRLIELGTTNRTRLADYEAALAGGEGAVGAVLKVLPSNFRQSGFVADVAPRDLAAWARRAGIPLVVDQGSGLPRPHRAVALRDYPSLAQLVADGCDLVAGSGDKLLGGPQAGLLVGRRAVVEIARRHPLYRALRPDRLTFAALEAVLRAQLAGEELPLDRLWPEETTHRARLEALIGRLRARGFAPTVEIGRAEAQFGGGAAPGQGLEGEVLEVAGGEGLARGLRQGDPAVLGYVRRRRLILDPRTLDPRDDDELVEALVRAGAAEGEE